MKNPHNLKIAISGKSGCGNTTVSKLTAGKLNLRFINFTFRNLAEEKGLTLQDILEKAKTDDSWDKEVDRRQAALAKESGTTGCVLGSRLAIWILQEADLKVYLKADPITRVNRIIKRESGSFESVSAFTKERDREDHCRYLHLYNIDNDDYSFADLIIDTDLLTPEEIAEKIIAKAENISANNRV
ncbi:MAG: AAA family ATPase [Spirochaetaceae bacterium]|jgi:cytidylate kinase|nr:AAA family ATPase [Spirochaetaceae bacterium]